MVAEACRPRMADTTGLSGGPSESGGGTRRVTRSALSGLVTLTVRRVPVPDCLSSTERLLLIWRSPRCDSVDVRGEPTRALSLSDDDDEASSALATPAP